MPKFHILKFKLTPDPGPQWIPIPVGSSFLSTKIQHGECYAWFLCSEDESRSVKNWPYLLVGTGWEIDAEAVKEYGKFLGTLSSTSTHFVWHLFTEQDGNK